MKPGDPRIPYGGTKTKRGRKNVLRKILEMCEQQGVDPNATLSAEDVKRFMGITHAEKNIITLIATGYPVRNAQTVIRAIEMKMERNPDTKRTQPNAGDAAAVSITVKTLGGEQVIPATLQAAVEGSKETDEDLS